MVAYMLQPRIFVTVNPFATAADAISIYNLWKRLRGVESGVGTLWKHLLSQSEQCILCPHLDLQLGHCTH